MNNAVDAIYSAALEPGLWIEAIGLVCDLVGADAGFLAGLDVRSGRGAYWYAFGHSQKIQDDYDASYVMQDPTLEQVLQEPGQAIIFTSEDFKMNPGFAGFYRDFLLPAGICSILSALICQRGSIFSFCGFQRLGNKSNFSSVDAERLQQLLPHFLKAEQIAASLRRMDESRKIALQALDKIEHGIIFIDQDRNIRLTNRSAEIMLENENVILSKFGRLFISTLERDVEFWRNVNLIDASSSIFSQRLDRRGVHGQTTITVLPLDSCDSSGFANGRPERIVFVSNGDALLSGAKQFARACGLTAAETRVVCGLANGQKPEDLSRALSISMATLKTHIQHVYQKTGMSRQSELVRACFGYLPLVHSN